jgi:hypothetical protein
MAIVSLIIFFHDMPVAKVESKATAAIPAEIPVQIGTPLQYVTTHVVNSQLIGPLLAFGICLTFQEMSSRA